MNREFTPAAQRALASAARWGRVPDEPLGPVQLLLGLLDEPECRGAALLAARGIDADAVRCRWPDLRLLSEKQAGKPVALDEAKSESRAVWARLPASFAGGGIPLSDTVRELLHEAECRLNIELTSSALATEHLLLGLISGEHEVAKWLREQGIDAEELEAEILRVHGVSKPDEATAADVPIGPPLDIPDEYQPQKHVVRVETVPEGSCAAVPTSCEVPGAAKAERETEYHADESAVSWQATEACDAGVGFRMPAEGARLVRVLDAAANRAAEATRVIEDYVRFLLDDRCLTACCKQLRHDLTAALKQIPHRQRLAGRDTQHDVGTQLSTDAESRRDSLEDVLAANFGRLEQALRSLEEFGKLLGAGPGNAFKQLRYRVYTLEKAVTGTVEARQRLRNARLCVLVDGCKTYEAFERLAEQLIASGVPLIQLRDKRLDDRQLLRRAQRLRELTRGTMCQFVVNDRPDLALLVGADGVHVGQDDLRVRDVRAVVGSKMLVGVSTHSIEQAREAVLDGADYIGVGPVFPSATKQFDAFLGLETLEAVAREIRLPAFAIGGIDVMNLDSVLATGIGRVAVARGVTDASDPSEAVRQLLNRLESAAPDPRG